MKRANLTPSKVDVPRPSSSRITSVRGVARRRISLVSCSSTMKVDLPRASSSEAAYFIEHLDGFKDDLCTDRPSVSICHRASPISSTPQAHTSQFGPSVYKEKAF